MQHKTFPGGKSDSKSFPDIIGELDAATRSIEDLPFYRPTVIMMPEYHPRSPQGWV